MPRAEPHADGHDELLLPPATEGSRSSRLTEQSIRSARFVKEQSIRGAHWSKEQGIRGAHWLKGVCTCRCSPLASGLIVFGVFAMLATLTVVSHTFARHWQYQAPPAPPEPCGTWPHFNPCGSCIYGANASLRYVVKEGDTCETIGKRFGVPQFDIFIRNTSLGCCESAVRTTDVVDLCNMPTREQWREAGHPRIPPETGVLASFVGMQPQAHRTPHSLPPPDHLSPSINTAILYSVIDIDNRGTFRMSPQFTGNCTTFIDPTMTERHDMGAQDNRVWMASLDIYAGNWNNAIPAEQWGMNAARTLEKIILRYRLDGIDVNIEASRSNFGPHICAMFKHLRSIDPGMLTTLTPWGQRWSQYSQVAACKDDLSWANYQTYSDLGFNPCIMFRNPPQCAVPSSLSTIAAAYGGFHKVAWGVSTESLNFRPAVASGLAFQKYFQETHPDMRGVAVWTSEFSSVCSPPWCYDELLAKVIAGEAVDLQGLEVTRCNCDGAANPAGHG